MFRCCVLAVFLLAFVLGGHAFTQTIAVPFDIDAGQPVSVVFTPVPMLAGGDVTVTIDSVYADVGNDLGDGCYDSEFITIDAEGAPLGVIMDCDPGNNGYFNNGNYDDAGYTYYYEYNNGYVPFPNSGYFAVVPGTVAGPALADGSLTLTFLFSEEVDYDLLPTDLSQITVTISFQEVVGGGGDPHIVSAQRLGELHGLLHAITGRDVGDADVTLLQSDTSAFVGHMTGQPGKEEKFFFTSFSLLVDGQVVEIASELVNNVAVGAVSTGLEQRSCDESTEEDLITLDGSAYIRLICGGAPAMAAANPVMAFKFPSHSEFARSVIQVETELFNVELFFVQKDLSSMDFGFYDFSVTYRTSTTLGGLLSNAPIEATSSRLARMTAEEHAKTDAHALSDLVMTNVHIYP